MQNDSSVDATEIEKFNLLSDQWWNPEGDFKILHQINPLRIDFIVSKIKNHYNIDLKDKPLSNIDILDVGCGGGLVSVPLYKLGANVTGIDGSENNIKKANYFAEQNNLNINYIKSTIEELIANNKQSDQLYDVITCLEVIEHVANPNTFISNIISLIKPGGVLILSTINRNIKSYLLAIIIAERILKWVPQDTHNYNKLLKPSEINLMLKGEMIIKELKGLKFDIIDQLWYLSDDIDVNYFVYAVKSKK